MHSVFRRPGSDLLFRVLGRSTIGAGAIYGRVRDGIGYGHPAKATRPAKDRGTEAHLVWRECLRKRARLSSSSMDIDNESDSSRSND
jgi:hypothetical protein